MHLFNFQFLFSEEFTLLDMESSGWTKNDRSRPNERFPFIVGDYVHADDNCNQGKTSPTDTQQTNSEGPKSDNQVSRLTPFNESIGSPTNITSEVFIVIEIRLENCFEKETSQS